ncbi:MAG: hypothetical protein HY756_07470 [Nitrospirae bacterium]|nr:hypothetical protein [Nitrospirota bacterium]
MKKNLLSLLAVIFLIGCAATDKKAIETIFYPMPPEQPKIQFLVSISSEEDIGKKPGAFKEFLLGKAPSMKRIARPHDISAEEGKIYISDRTYKKILIIDLVKNEFDYIRAEKEGALDEPSGIWVTEEGYKYVADMDRKQIVVFDNNNKFLRAYGESGQFGKPTDVAVYKSKIYVCDFDKNQIIVVDKDSGKTIGEIGGIGTKEGYLHKPTNVVVDKEGNIYVNDSFNFRMQKFSPEGKYVKRFGYQGDTLGGFARPKGLDIDKEGHLYVADTAFENVQIFDDETTDLLLFFGGYGPAPGSMYLPNAVYVDYKNAGYFKKYADKDFSIRYLIYIGNMLGDNKLNVYGFGDWVGAPLPVMEKKKTEEKDGKKTVK